MIKVEYQGFPRHLIVRNDRAYVRDQVHGEVELANRETIKVAHRDKAALDALLAKLTQLRINVVEGD